MVVVRGMAVNVHSNVAMATYYEVTVTTLLLQ